MEAEWACSHARHQAVVINLSKALLYLAWQPIKSGGFNLHVSELFWRNPHPQHCPRSTSFHLHTMTVYIGTATLLDSIEQPTNLIGGSYDKSRT